MTWLFRPSADSSALSKCRTRAWCSRPTAISVSSTTFRSKASRSIEVCMASCRRSATASSAARHLAMARRRPRSSETAWPARCCKNANGSLKSVFMGLVLSCAANAVQAPGSEYQKLASHAISRYESVAAMRISVHFGCWTCVYHALSRPEPLPVVVALSRTLTNRICRGIQVRIRMRKGRPGCLQSSLEVHRWLAIDVCSGGVHPRADSHRAFSSKSLCDPRE